MLFRNVNNYLLNELVFIITEGNILHFFIVKAILQLYNLPHQWKNESKTGTTGDWGSKNCNWYYEQALFLNVISERYIKGYIL